MKKKSSGSGYISPRIALENRCAEQNRQLVDLAAENSKLRTEIEEQKIAGHYQVRKALLNFIEVSDAMERLIKHVEERLADNGDIQATAWPGNLRSVYKLLQRSLQRSGVELISVEPGEKADPERHTVLEVATDPNRENEEITAVIKNGYWWRGTVLRASEVRIVLNGSQDRKD